MLKLCKERNTTVAALEKAAGLSNGSIWKWGNRSKKSPNADAVKAVATVFGVSMDELMGGSNGKPQN